MKSQVVSAVRFPTRQAGMSLESGSSATKVYWSLKLGHYPQFHTVRLSWSSVATWRHGTRDH